MNWCPGLGTVLANEEVIDGKSERGGHPVVRMPLRQWMLRITAYADRLEKRPGRARLVRGHQEAAAQLDRPQHRGRGRFLHRRSEPQPSQGRAGSRRQFKAWRTHARGEAAFRATPADDVLRVYTTRPDTLFGATYMVIAPEHPFVERLTTPEQQAARRSLLRAGRQQERPRPHRLAKEKTGVFTGSYAINPVNGQPVPIWVADYVLMSYGTGAIMAVPAHDERDFEFAKQFELPIVPVVDPGDSDRRRSRERVLAGKRCFAGRRHGDQLRHLQRPADGRVQTADHRRPGRRRRWAARR